MSAGSRLLFAGRQWPPANAVLYCDFGRGLYMRSGLVVPAATAFELTRASTKMARSLFGVWSSFAVDVAAITDRGLSIEPAATNLFLRSNDFNNASWAKTNVTVTSASLSALGLSFDKIAATASASTSLGQFVASAGSASGNTFSLIVGKGSGAADGNRFYFQNTTAGTFFQGIQLDLDTGAISYLSGSSGASVEKLADGYWRLSLTGTPPAGNTLRGYVGYAGGVTETAGEYSNVSSAQLETGLVATSPIATTAASATRSADAGVLHLPQLSDLHFMFDDGSRQVVTGQSGDYAIPTNLNRPTIKTITALAV